MSVEKAPGWVGGIPSEPEPTVEKVPKSSADLPVPVAEKKGEGVSEFHDKTIAARQEAVDKLLSDGLPAESPAWQKLNMYMTQHWNKPEQPKSFEYFQQPAQYAAFQRFAENVQKKGELADTLAEFETNPTPEALSSLQTLKSFSVVLNEAVRADAAGLNDEMNKRLLRLSEVAYFEAVSLEMKHGLFHGEAAAYLPHFEALAATQDINAELKGRFRERASVIRMESMKAEAPPKPAPALPEPSQPKAEALKQPEKIFGNDLLSSDDIKAASLEVNDLLKQNTPESVLLAAREMAHLKKLGVTAVESRRKALFDALLTQREAIRQAGDTKKMAQYLTYLKYVGAITEIAPPERAALQEAVQRSVDGKNIDDLAVIAVHAKNLGVEPSPEALNALEFDVTRLVEEKQYDKVALRLARLKYLGVSSEGLKLQARIAEQPIVETLNRLRTEKKASRFAAVLYAVSYYNPGGKITADEEKLFVDHAATLRKASPVGQRRGFLRYLCKLRNLSAKSRSATVYDLAV